MNHLNGPVNIRRYMMVSLFFVSLLYSDQLGFSAEPETPSSPSQSQLNQPSDAGEIQERGLPNLRQGPSLGKAQMGVPSPPPGGGLPPNSRRPVTQMLTQCKCFNQTDCQSLTTICPIACPAGGQRCQCIPTFRGTAPALPQNCAAIKCHSLSLSVLVTPMQSVNSCRPSVPVRVRSAATVANVHQCKGNDVSQICERRIMHNPITKKENSSCR